jgi:hypothetical protein
VFAGDIAGFIAFAGILFAGLIAFATWLAAFEATCAALAATLAAFETAAGTLATTTGLFAGVLFAAESPQAIPIAPKPRTAESTITFFILFIKLLSLSQRINY